jgi:DNA processing protein
MSLLPDTVDLLALWLIPGLGPRRIARAMAQFDPLSRVFDEPIESLAERLRIPRAVSTSIRAARDSVDLKNELRLIDQYQLSVLDIRQPNYPVLLKETWSPPPVLYTRGDIDLNVGLPIAFVGSRKASFAGKSFSRKLIARLAELDPSIIIVSGLAIGIDSAAHKSALEFGLRTVAVLGGGLADIYPRQNSKLATSISSNGALVTEFPVASKPLAINFPLRNRIISGISKGTLVVEAGERSGATITAGYALEQNRELFALPGPADSRFHLGTNRLIQSGQAKLVIEAEDILVELQSAARPFVKGQQMSFLESVPPIVSLSEQAVLDQLESGAQHRDLLAAALGLPVNQLLPLLTTLEVKGVIISKPGAVYQIA